MRHRVFRIKGLIVYEEYRFGFPTALSREHLSLVVFMSETAAVVISVGAVKKPGDYVLGGRWSHILLVNLIRFC